MRFCILPSTVAVLWMIISVIFRAYHYVFLVLSISVLRVSAGAAFDHTPVPLQVEFEFCPLLGDYLHVFAPLSNEKRLFLRLLT